MYRVILIGLFTLLSLRAWGHAADPPPNRSLNIGIAGEQFNTVPPALVNVLGKPFRDLIQRNTGVSGEFKIYSDCDKLLKNLQSGECRLAVFHGFEFAWAKAVNDKLTPLVVTEYHTGRPQACVIVRDDCRATKLNDLTVEQIVVPKGTRNHCLIYLEQFGVKRSPETEVKHGSIETVQAMDDVVNGKCVAVVVDYSALKGYQVLAPGAARQLRVLSKSDLFPQNVIAYQKGAISEELVKKLQATLTQAHTTPAGKPLMVMWNIKNFAEIPAIYDKQLEECSKIYPPPARSIFDPKNR